MQLTKRAAGEGDAVRVMHEPIKDRIDKCGVTDQVVPVVDRYLAGDEGRASTRVVLDDLEQIVPLPIAQGRESP